MADNYLVGGLEFAADEVGSVLHPRVKLQVGADGAATDVSDAAPLPMRPVSPPFWRIGFAEVGSGLRGKAAQEMVLVQTGAGMTVSQTGGNLTIATGTTANSETVIRSQFAFRGSFAARYKAILSQRIANQTFRFELADLIGEGLAYTINSATSVTVTFPTTNPFTSESVGQFLRLSTITGAAGIPGRYAIASVSGLTVTFTVAGWPASGSGTLTLYGHNWLANEYSGTTATNSSFDCQRRGWASGNTNITISTTASPGHVVNFAFDVQTAGIGDASPASNGGYQWTTRGSRIENIPDEDVDLYFFIVVQNGSTAPASTTTLTVGFVQVEDQGRQKVRVASSDPTATHALPTQVVGGNVGVSGTVTANIGTGALAAGTNAIGDVGLQGRANATGAASVAKIASAASTNATSVKTTGGRVFGWSLTNTTAAVKVVRLYNLAAAPTVGTSVPFYNIVLPANATVNASFPVGIGHATGIAYAITNAIPDLDATAVAANDVIGAIYWL